MGWILIAMATAWCAPAAAALRVGERVGTPLARGYAGLSIETDLLGEWFPRYRCQTSALQVLRMLGSPSVRVGGNSQDRLWPWLPLPPTQRALAGAGYRHGLRCLASTGAPIEVGLNLLGGDPRATGDLLAMTMAAVPAAQLRIAIGNEPNMHRRVLPTLGSYEDFLQRHRSTVAALRERFGDGLPPIAGPDAATWRWEAESVRFIADARPAVVNAHLYGLSACARRRGFRRYPTVERLLRRSTSIGLVRQLEPIAAAARGAGIPAEISEANSVACRGKRGVSDTPASALWALNVLGTAATAGFTRVHFHNSGRHYDVFRRTGGGRLETRPLLTALVLAKRLWPDGTQPLAVLGRRPGGLDVWAGTRPDGRLGLLAVNRSRRTARRLELRTPVGAFRAGQLLPERGRAVSLDGRRLGWSGQRLAWRGRRTTRAFAARRGTLRVRVPPTSAVWLRSARGA
jgi:hypothetical protein